MLYPLYRFATRFLGPTLFKGLLRRRVARDKEEASRLGERYGQASHPRPEGRLIWMHGASLGETTTLLPLIDRFLAEEPDLSILVTSGTRSSAQMLEKRLPDRAFHQFLPLDVPGWGERFLNFWQPALVLWMESEIWPNLLHTLKKRGIPLCLINAHFSPKSQRAWRWFPGTARKVFASFDLILAQNEEMQGFFQTLGIPNSQITGNLKFAAPPLPDNPQAREHLDQQIGSRPFWLAASTHPGEEALLAEVHAQLQQNIPRLLTLIVPRHPERGAALQKALEQHLRQQCGQQLEQHCRQQHRVARRSQGDPLGEETALYLIDTVGDLGWLYRLAEVVFVGGSLVDIGGHNLVEPAQLGCALIHGPYMGAQTEMRDFFKAGGATESVADGGELSQAVQRLLSSQDVRERRAKRAQEAARERGRVLEVVWEALKPYWNREQRS